MIAPQQRATRGRPSNDQRFHSTHVSVASARRAVTAALLALFPAAAWAAADPQVTALESLRRESAVPVQARFEHGTARSLTFDLPAIGRTPVAQARDFLNRYGDLLLRNDDAAKLPGANNPGVELRVRGVHPGDGLDTVAFHQVIGGLPVLGGGVVIGVRTGGKTGTRVVLASGALLPAVQRDPDLIPAIDERMAADSAAEHLRRMSPPLLDDPRLMLWSDTLEGGQGPLKLVWVVGIGGGTPWQVVVDANDIDGAVLFATPLAQEGAGVEDYDLDYEDANGDNAVNTNCFNPTTIDDQMGNEDGLYEEYLSDADAATGWWHLRNTYLYYHDHLGRHSWDDDDEQILVYLHSNFATNNGQFVNNCGIELTNGYISLDVMAHEFTHGVINNSPSNLAYQNQSGALNESFADLLGEMADPDGDWLHREDVLSGIGPNRSLKDPTNDLCGPPASANPCGAPDRMTAFLVTASDNGGVHTNSGIPNKAGYLMAVGGSFNGVNVGAGMGRYKFERLAYYVMRFAPTFAQFTDARALYISTATSWAAVSQYGFTSSDVCKVRNAWAAVEVGVVDTDCDGLEDNVDDSDNDLVFADVDNCPNVANPAQDDWDGDGNGDACDPDADDDGCPNALDKCPMFDNGPCYGLTQTDFDGDGLGEACDPDDDNDGIADGVDNCQYDENPDQFDGNNDGFGDACDPDQDSDGDYGLDDNCTFVDNPDQTDTDGDGMGDACDLCPDVADNANAYTSGFPEFGIDPKPYQPDSDGDGVPDACDETGFDTLAVGLGGRPYNPTNPLRPDGKTRPMVVSGLGSFRLPLPGCGGDDDVLTSKQRIEVTVSGLPEDVDLGLWIADELGRRVARLSDGKNGEVRGMRYLPDCLHRYSLRGATGSRFSAPVEFSVRSQIAAAGKRNPWTLPEPTGELARPTPPLDGDRDGIVDGLDNCVAAYNPTQTDTTGDGVGDACQDDCRVGGCPIEVPIDVKPGNERNVLKLRSRGRLQVAVLSTAEVDATQIDPASILVDGAPVINGKKGLPIRVLDVDRDGRSDLMFDVQIPLMAVSEEKSRVDLVAKTLDGRDIHGSDEVTAVP